MTQTRKWSVLTAVAVVLVLVAGWFLLISPKRSEAAELTAQTDTVTAENQLLETQIATLQAQQKQLPEWQAELAQIRTQLPASPALPGLIRTLSDEADRAGIELVSLTPNTPVVYGASSTTGLVPEALAGLDVQLQVSGGYFEIQQFVNNLERMERVMLVLGLTMAEGGDETESSGTLTGTVSGRVFLVPPVGTTTTTTTTATTTETTTETGTSPASE